MTNQSMFPTFKHNIFPIKILANAALSFFGINEPSSPAKCQICIILNSYLHLDKFSQ